MVKSHQQNFNMFSVSLWYRQTAWNHYWFQAEERCGRGKSHSHKVTRQSIANGRIFRGFTHDKLSRLSSFAFDQLETTIFLNYFLFPSLDFIFNFACLLSFFCLIVNITWDYYQMPQIFIEDFLWARNKCHRLIHAKSKKKEEKRKNWERRGLSLSK